MCVFFIEPFLLFFFFFFFYCTRSYLQYLVPPPGIKPRPPSLGAQSLSHRGSPCHFVISRTLLTFRNWRSDPSIHLITECECLPAVRFQSLGFWLMRSLWSPCENSSISPSLTFQPEDRTFLVLSHFNTGIIMVRPKYWNIYFRRNSQNQWKSKLSSLNYQSF